MAGEAGTGGGNLADGNRNVDLRCIGLFGIERQGASCIAENAEIIIETKMADPPADESVAGVGIIRPGGNSGDVHRARHLRRAALGE